MAKNDLTTRNLMLDSLKQYAKNRISHEFIREHDAKNEIPLDILKEMYDHDVLGVHLLLIPEEYGGLGGQTTEIYLCARLCGSAVDLDPAAVASLVGYRAAFYYSRYFEEFVKSHITSFSAKRGVPPAFCSSSCSPSRWVF